MTIFEDFLLVNKEALKKAWDSFAKNWPIALTAIAYSLINVLAYSLVSIIFRGPLYILAGFVNGFITASLISNYLYLLFNVINYNRITFQDFKYGFKAFLRPVYSVLVFIWIISYFLSVFGIVSPRGSFSINLLVGLFILISLNALPETIYQKQYIGMDSIVYSLEFARDNIVNWYIPNIAFGLLIYLVSGNIITDIFMTNININLIYSDLALAARDIMGQLIFSFMMIYRGYLYRTLSTSTKRKREYMNKF